MGYSIKTISQKSGLSQYTLRYYEREGLLPYVSRDEHGNRCFDDEDLDLISWICCLRDTGMPIAEIKKFVELSQAGKDTFADRRKLLMEHKLHIEEQIRFYQKYAQKIEHKINYFASLEKEVQK